jgi:hypothetical protein
MNTISIATFNNDAKAQPLKDRLEKAGIPAEIHDESYMERLWFVARPLAVIRVTVLPRDFEKALGLLGEWDISGGPLAGAIRCPECSSCRVQYPQYASKSLLPNLMIGLLAVVGVIKREFYCQDCHYTWPKKGTRRSKVRPHSAPYYFLDGIDQSVALSRSELKSK